MRDYIRCSACRYYEDNVCKRYPPQVVVDKRNNFIPRYPKMKPTDRCGEHRR